MAKTTEQLLDDAISVLRRGGVVTIDSVATEAGMSKAGVVHHFPTKEALMVGVVDRVLDRWEAQLAAIAKGSSDPIERLRAYVDLGVLSDFDGGDLALLADVKLRDTLTSQWQQRLRPWFGEDAPGTGAQTASLRAARLIADGAWTDQALGLLTMTGEQKALVRSIAQRLIDEGSQT
jgi:AcrR family transcriptional regulator